MEKKPLDPPRLPRADLLIWVCAIAGLALKFWCAATTIGSNDVKLHFLYARAILDHGLIETYKHVPLFNHTPLTASYFTTAYTVAESLPMTHAFPFCLKFPVIIADFLTVLGVWGVWRGWRGAGRPPVWTVCLFALSPVAFMVNGYHGNFDAMMVLFLFLAACACLGENAALCGLFLGLACNFKIIPILISPIFFFFWMHRGKAIPFAAASVITCLAGWSPALIGGPVLFLKNVLAYSSYWGIWGLTYWLRATQWKPFEMISFMGLTWEQRAVMSILKFLIVGAVIVLAWRRRAKPGSAIFETITYAWMIFFVFAPGACAQYLIWFAPFMAISFPGWYAAITAASSLFLFSFYDSISHGFMETGSPWYYGESTNPISAIWTPWTNWPWVLMILFLVEAWRGTRGSGECRALNGVAHLKESSVP